jgi:hypothetical protein
MCAVRLAFGAFNVPSAANCFLSYMELHRRKFCNNQLEHRTTGERADTMLNFSSEPGCSAVYTTLYQAVVSVPLCTNIFYYSWHNFTTLYGTQLMATCFGLSLEPSSYHSRTRKFRRIQVWKARKYRTYIYNSVHSLRNVDLVPFLHSFSYTYVKVDF